MEPEIRSFLTLSTAHITQLTGDRLSTNMGDICVGGTIDYGWFIYADYENNGAIPDDLWGVMVYARANDCDYILFDRDADCIEYLPTWDW